MTFSHDTNIISFLIRGDSYIQKRLTDEIQLGNTIAVSLHNHKLEIYR